MTDQMKPTNDDESTPMLDEMEQGSALIQVMSQKVAFYSMLVAHLLTRLEAVTPQSAVHVTPRHQKQAVGVALMMGEAKDEPEGRTFGIYVQMDERTVEYVRTDETTRRKDNGIGQPKQTRDGSGSGDRPVGSGIIGINGQEFQSTQGRTTKPTDSGTTGEIS